jgi:hypothetical protein
VIFDSSPIGQSNLLKKFQQREDQIKTCGSPTSSIMSLIKNKIGKPKQSGTNINSEDKTRLKIDCKILFPIPITGKENCSITANKITLSTRAQAQKHPFDKCNLKSEASIALDSVKLTQRSKEEGVVLKTPSRGSDKKRKHSPRSPSSTKMMSRIGWLFELRNLFDKLKRKSAQGTVNKEQFLVQMKRITGVGNFKHQFLNLIEKEEYKAMKNELGLTVENVERRLLNISRNELTEDLLIAAIMQERSDCGSSTSREREKCIRPRKKGEQLYYEDLSESALRPENYNQSEEALNQNRTIAARGRAHNKIARQQSGTNSAESHSPPSNRIFERRRSSSKSDVETARFNKVEGLASSRNYENHGSKYQSAKPSKPADILEESQMDFQIREVSVEATPAPHVTPLLNTFSTIKPPDIFDCPQNTTSKHHTQTNILKQLDRKDDRGPSTTGVESFEFTHGADFKNQSGTPNNIQRFLRTNKSNDWNKKFDATKLRLQKDSVNCKIDRTIHKSGDYRAFYAQTEEDRRPTSRQSKRSLKNSIGEHPMASVKRKPSRSRDVLAKKVIENITKILESINASQSKAELMKEEKVMLEAINSLHVFEFKNACVLGLDLRDCGELTRICEGTLVPSTHFRQLVENIGILRIHNSTVSSKTLSFITHPNTILLTLTRCNLTSLHPICTLDSLKLLNVSDNLLKSLDGIQKHSSLTELYANNNQLSSLQDLKTLKSLKVLSLSFNAIVDVSELHYLRRCSALTHLRLFGNPICMAKDYSSTVSLVLAKVKQLDYFDAEVNRVITKTSDFKDFVILWKDGSGIYKETKTETSKRRNLKSVGSRSAKRQKSNNKSSKREKHSSAVPEEHLEIYGFLKQQREHPTKSISVSQVMLGRQESAPFLLKDKISHFGTKGVSSTKSKRSAEKSSRGDHSKRKHCRSITGKKLIF